MLQRHRESLESVDTQQDSYGEILDLSFPEFCKTLKIKTDKGLQPFELFDWQENFTDYLLSNSRKTIALLSSRQTGKTSSLLAFMVWCALSRKQFSGLLIHRTTADSYLLCRRLKKLLPPGTPLTTDSLSLLEFTNSKSTLHFRSSNPRLGPDGAEQTGRGLESIDIAIVEEASHTSNLADVKGVVAPTMTWGSPGTLVYVGTASSKQSYYFDHLAASANGEQRLETILAGIRAGTEEPYQVLAGEGGQVSVVTNWRAIDRFKDEPDFLARIQSEHSLTDEQIATEYELAFVSTVDEAIFDYSAVQACATGQYAEPIDGKLYYCGLDCSTTGADYTVFSVFEWDTSAQTLSLRHLYRQRKKPSEYHLLKILKLIERYKPQSVGVELNHVGAIYAEQLEKQCRGVEIVGQTTTEKTKQTLISRLNLAIEKSSIAYPDEDSIIGEFLCFRRNGKKMEGKPHDDCVISFAEAVSVSPFNPALFVDLNSEIDFDWEDFEF